MTPEIAAWVVFLAPLASFLAIVFGLRPSGAGKAAGWVTILAVAVAFAASLSLFVTVANTPGHELDLPSFSWLKAGSLDLRIGFAVDSLTAIMLIVVTSVSLLVQIYSLGYMRDDPGIARYYAYMSLFTASMLGLVLADNLFQVFVFWELVGLCSFLLIGFWFQRPSAAAAAKKAFVVTRFGDLAFLIALLAIFSVTGTFSIHELFGDKAVAALDSASFLGVSALVWVTLGIFGGAVGKSAQFPLHVWLPDAMEGPTPVSALIHAATMVAAGVYLVGRMLPLIHHAPETMGVVAIIGAFTAIFAASMGLVATDIKRVMAYSTVSQLGYMMLALGVGGFVAAFFHLMTHAFFKALLFLGSGSVSHAVGGTFNMRYMGGLSKVMPWTFATMLVASFSLAGVPPFAGFWSKDEILTDALAVSPFLFSLALITVFLTAFYVVRMLYLTFGGEYRGGAAAEANDAGLGGHQQGDSHGHVGAPHESPGVMIGPLVVLAIPSLLAGLVNMPGIGALTDFLTSDTVARTLGEHHEPFNPVLASVSTLVALAGMGFGRMVYGTKSISAESLGSIGNGVPYRVLLHKYGMDFLYERVFVGFVLYTVIADGAALFERYVVDGAVNGVGRATKLAGQGLRRAQTGQIQTYGLAVFLGIIIITAAVMFRG